MDKKIKNLIAGLGKAGIDKERMLFGESLAKYTTFRIGGPADLFIEIRNEEELTRIIKVIKEEGLAYFILGGGSNILVGDRGFRGIVIKIQNSKFKIQSLRPELKPRVAMFKVYVEAGVKVSVLLEELVKDSIFGFEFMVGVPGTVGGAIRGNAGAWQQSISECVSRVKILTEDLETKWLNKEECQFDYRESRFKHNNEIILEVELIMEKGEKKEIERKIKEYLEKRSCQPKEPSAGCIFMNPKPASAGELIEKCGLKGVQIGGAKISEKHANFIVNVGSAKASDVVALIDLAKEKVKEKFNIELKEEIIRVGEF